ncbi:unnamed protein product [Paramecium pentaurelia]|uniref:Uncharacterized protein n=1 Tax=Paramecium pentaurelia TaxID=43138 RepID=A0A8S1TEG0_9CILI|nr:unnamed protein product [Paramecium pentaurelia]
MNKLKQENQKGESKNIKLTNSKINLRLENQLSKIYKSKENCLFCISCQQDIMQHNIYNHLFEPLHILKLQEGFIKIGSSKVNKREKALKKIESKNQKTYGQQIKKEDQKNKIILIPSKVQELPQNINANPITKFIETLQFDLKSIDKIQLSLIISILVKSYCTINEIIEMKFSQIIDKCTVYYLNINDSWKKNYLILKERFPDYLQEFISKNAGSDKPLIKLLGQNKRQTLSKELYVCCSKIQNLTNDEDYISFLKGLTLKKLKKITIERISKRNLIQHEEIGQKNQEQIKDQDFSINEQHRNLEKKQVIKIIIKQKVINSQKQELTD